MLVQYDKSKFGNFTGCFTYGGKLYIVACTAPEAISLYYQELFKEIIETIGMD